MEKYPIIAYYAVLLPNMSVLPRKLSCNAKDYCLCIIIYYLLMAFPAFYIQKLRLVARFVWHIMSAELRAREAALDPACGSAHVGGSCMLAQAAPSKAAQAGPSPITVAASGGQRLARMGLPVRRSLAVTNRHLGISKT